MSHLVLTLPYKLVHLPLRLEQMSCIPLRHLVERYRTSVNLADERPNIS